MEEYACDLKEKKMHIKKAENFHKRQSTSFSS